jgi:phytoene synthase
MNVAADPDPRASYALCRRLARQSGSNFYLGFLLLPARKRRGMDALYAFMRHTDDLADNRQPVDARARALADWRGALERALAGNSPVGSSHDLLPALADTVRRFHIPPEHLRAVIDGVEMDLHRRRYETFAELEQYCQRVASAVGMACICIWGSCGGRAAEPARKCGLALQLTNILRDLGEDAREDRVYLPLDEMRRFGYSVDDLKAGRAGEQFERLVAFQIERAEAFYREGAALMELLEPDSRRVFGMTMSVYRAILAAIERRPADVLSRRIRLGRLRKLAITLRWLLLPPRADGIG